MLDETAIALTDGEAQRLQAYEAVISRGLQTFIEVGQALLAIRDQRLYRATHNSFADYCYDRWQISRPQAYRLIDAAQVAENLSPIGDTPKPSHESQVRPLAKLEPEEQREVWAQAVAESKGQQPTAAKVAEVACAHAKAISPANQPMDEEDSWKTILKPDSQFIPPPGCLLSGSCNKTRLLIAPSAEHEGYCFVVRLHKGLVETNKRPIRNDTVEWSVSHMAGNYSAFEWERIPSSPWPYNIYLPERAGEPSALEQARRLWAKLNSEERAVFTEEISAPQRGKRS